MTHDANQQFAVWSYTQMGRTFVIDTSVAGDNNILKAVCEIQLPYGSLVKDQQESPFDYKIRTCQAKEVMAERIVRGLRIVEASNG